LPAFFRALSFTVRLQRPLFSHSHPSSLSSYLSHALSFYLFGFCSFFFFLNSVFIPFFGTSQNTIYEEIKSRLKSENVLLLFGAE
jgi:hypothetical protein